MKNYQEYNNKLFARWAPIYDGFEIILAGVRKEMLQEIDPSNKSVLDIATGTGSLAIALSTKAKKVIGIDLSQEMLNVAKKKSKNSNLSFLQMDASKMDFQDQEFDIVTISLGLHDMPLEVRSAVLEEAKRVLKKDGKIYVLEHDLPQNKLLAWCSLNFTNSFESKYYREFVNSNLLKYLESFGFKMERKTNYLFCHLQLLKLVIN